MSAALAGVWFGSPLLGLAAGKSFAATAAAEIILTMAWVALVIQVVREVTRLRLSFWTALLCTGISAIVLVLVTINKLSQPLPSLTILFTSAFLGCVISVIFRERNVLVPVALLAPIIDYWTVKFGPVSQAIVSPKDILPAVSVSVPSAFALKPLALMGAGDFLFMAMFLAAAERFEMQADRTSRLFMLMVAMAMVLVIWVDAIGRLGMPGLVVISLAFLVANWQYFRLTRAEVGITTTILIIAIAVVGFIQFQR